MFAPNGGIIECTVNSPRSMKDFQIYDCGVIYVQMEQIYDFTIVNVVVDSSFGRDHFECLIKSAHVQLVA